MDKILALYSTHELAELVRTQLSVDGFPTDRIDVVSWNAFGRAVMDPNKSVEENLTAHFSVIFSDTSDAPLVGTVVGALKVGKASVVVHPRGQIEIELARDILEGHSPETVFWRVTPTEAQGGLLGEHAAGG